MFIGDEYATLVRMRVSRAAAALLSLSSVAAAQSRDDFWQRWGDGRAELDGYSLVQPRYGEPREGTAVLIFVTEDMSDSLRVKADPGKHPSSDVYPVLKLNAQREFQTGIYHYNVLSSTFARTEFSADDPWPVMKTSFSAQEWCGHVYAQWLRRGAQLVGAAHSYFDGEADAAPVLALPAGGVLEEALPILVRGLRGDWLAPGAARTVPLLPSLLRARFAHRPQAWTEAVVRRAADSVTVSSALGRVRAVTWTVDERGGRTTTYVVEEAQPHRILSWRTSDGESATLLGSARLPYWELNGRGGESYLGRLGLAPRGR
jgi:hypothetical protein